MKVNVMNKKMSLIIVSIISIIAVVVFLYFRKRKQKGSEGSEDIYSANPSGQSPVAQLPQASFPLTPYSHVKVYSAAKGSYGQQIANLQKICNDKFGKNLAVDGKFGPKSESAFLTCFGSPLVMPYSEEVYNGLMLQHGGGLGLA